MAENYENYSQVKDRLDSIVDKVTDENISLDEALDLYDEAVKLAMRASDMIEIDTDDDDESGDEGGSDVDTESKGVAEREVKSEPSVRSESRAESDTEFGANVDAKNGAKSESAPANNERKDN